MKQEKDIDTPEWLSSKERELSTAKHTSPFLVDNIDTAITKQRLYAKVQEAGLEGVTTEQIESLADKQVHLVGDHTARLCQTFNNNAVQEGPRGQDRAMPKIFGDDSPDEEKV